jgi:hypothetical protein
MHPLRDEFPPVCSILGGRSTIAEPGSQALAQIPISMRLVPKPPVGTIASVTTEHLPFDEAADNMA